jgi:hypothetical protein
MTNPQTIDVLAVRVCQAVRDVREEHEAWIGIDCLNEFLGLDDLRLVDAALAFASALHEEALSDPRRNLAGSAGANHEMNSPTTDGGP